MVLIKCHHVLFHAVRTCVATYDRLYLRMEPAHVRHRLFGGHPAVLQAFDIDLISMSSIGTV